MSHELTITEGFILKAYDVAEASRMLSIYTEEAGLVLARAQGVREFKSKMRYSLQPFSLTYISLIRGREYWRIVNSQEPEDFSDMMQNRAKRELVARVFSLVSRLVQGEEQNKNLFHHLRKTFYFLKNTDLNKSQLHNLEVIVSLNILYLLGYLPESDNLKTFISFEEWSESILDSVTPLKNEALHTIRRSFDQTHL